MTTAIDHAHYWTADDVLALPDTDVRLETFGGALIVNPPPHENHQNAAFHLESLLRRGDVAGMRVRQAVGVRLPNNELAIPDLVVIDPAAPSSNAFEARHIHLAVEIVSPGSRGLDRITKPDAYAAAGIPWYWRVELNDYRGRTHVLPVIHVYSLSGLAEYAEDLVCGAGDLLTMTEPVPVSFDPADLTR